MSNENLSQGLQSFQVPGGNFGFTGMQIGDPTMAMEQTLYSLAVDESGSTLPFRTQMSGCTQEIIKSLRHSPRADNLMFRLTHFGTGIREIHGFKTLQKCNVGDYANVFSNAGRTELYDATLDIAEATRIYAEKLANERYMSNGVLVVLTDGCDYGSVHTPKDVQQSFEQMVQGEMLESLMTILIGVNIEDDHVKSELETFKDKAGFNQFITVKDASEKTMAKIADFISRSVSSQSQALGSGGASQSLTF
jgi:hypothetical protein